jgi:hypothetical protein
VLEAEVNAEGLRQFDPDGRDLAGIHLGGSGKGLEVAVSCLFTQDAVNLGRFADDTSDGLRAFFWSGETPEALEAAYVAMRARLAAWAPFPTWFRDIRAWELSGSSDGLNYMGCMLIYRVLQ